MNLTVQNITKTFGEKQVLKGISFTAESGKALGLLGRNGAGKTTTIRILMDVFHADSGEILLDGAPFHPAQTSIGYLPEERGLYPKRTVMEQLVYLARLRGLSRKQAAANALRWLTRLQVDQYQSQLLETLSKGNQQKVQLASTLLCDPDIVILDEPFSGLDPVNSQILKDVVEELIEAGKIVLFSSHQMSYVEEFCEDIVIIHHGETALSGNLSEIKRDFGKNQLVLGLNGIAPDQAGTMLTPKITALATITGHTKEDVILKLHDDVTRAMLLQALVACPDLEIEHFETYKPSLNDIFVAKVGEDEA